MVPCVCARALTLAIVRAQHVQQVDGSAPQQLLTKRVAAPQLQVQLALRSDIPTHTGNSQVIAHTPLLPTCTFGHGEQSA